MGITNERRFVAGNTILHGLICVEVTPGSTLRTSCSSTHPYQ